MPSFSRVAVVPAYEPSELMIGLVRQLCEAGFSVVVVDDGSGEPFHPVFEAVAPMATVLTHPQNRGKGCALRTAFDYLVAQPTMAPSVIVTLDADGQHTLPDTIRVCDAAEQHPDAVVLGCRSFCGKVPLRSRFGNGVTRLVYRLSSGTRVSDTQTGLRAFHSDLLAFMRGISGDRYEYEMNVLLACPGARIPFVEVPIETVYINDNAASHFHPLRDSVRIYREVLKFAGSSLISFLVDYVLFIVFGLLSASLGEAVSVPLSNVLARLVSASVNYTLNRRFVFRSNTGLGRSLVQYVVLAALVLAGNTLVVSFLTGRVGIPQELAKLLTEVLFFLLSWLAQHFIVFRTRKSGDDT